MPRRLATNQLATDAVTTPRTAIPVSMTAAAISLPSVVTGNLSP
jgi:hypothetical protein